MTKQKPLEEEQGVSVLVTENWPHNGHPREVPLSDDIKHEAPVLGQVAAGNRKSEVGQPDLAGMTCHGGGGRRGSWGAGTWASRPRSPRRYTGRSAWSAG